MSDYSKLPPNARRTVAAVCFYPSEFNIGAVPVVVDTLNPFTGGARAMPGVVMVMLAVTSTQAPPGPGRLFVTVATVDPETGIVLDPNQGAYQYPLIPGIGAAQTVVMTAALSSNSQGGSPASLLALTMRVGAGSTPATVSDVRMWTASKY